MANTVPYKNINYKDLQPILWKKFTDAAGDEHTEHLMKLALKIDKTVITVRNCFQPAKQVVSDEVFTKIMVLVGVDGKVEWVNGQRNYYIKNSKK